MQLTTMRLCALAVALCLAGCNDLAFVGIPPQCNEDWVKEAAIEAFKENEREEIEGRLSMDKRLDHDCPADQHAASEYLDQEFRLVAVRAADLEDGTRSCQAEIHGRKLTIHNFCERNPATLTDEVQLIARDGSYIIFFDDDGNAHVRTLTRIVRR